MFPTSLQKLIFPLNANKGLPLRTAAAAPGAWARGPGVQREAPLRGSFVRANSAKNAHDSNDCEPKHFTTPFCFFPSKVVKQPFSPVQ